MILTLLLAVHLLGAVIWVGGLAFALLVLTPAASGLDAAPRVALAGRVYKRFFLITWHAMPLILLTGYAMVFGYLGGFQGVAWPVHVMHLLGLIMAAVFVVMFFGPWGAMRAAQAAGDQARQVEQVRRIRRLLGVNLVLGLLTVAVAAAAQF
jgi:uncharacterized membrane protein